MLFEGGAPPETPEQVKGQNDAFAAIMRGIEIYRGKPIFHGLGNGVVVTQALSPAQDHPARDMQDTFYMRHPATALLPGEYSPAVSAGNPSQNGSAICYRFGAVSLENRTRKRNQNGRDASDSACP